MSAEAFEEDTNEAKMAGMNDYITKHVDSADLLQVLVKNIKR